MKCAFLQGDLDEERVDDDDDDDNFNTFCEPVPELSRKLLLEHHQCIRLLKAVYGLVNAPRRWCHRVATDFRNLTGEESVMEPCLWTVRGENGVNHALCLVYVDDFMLSCSDSLFGKNVFESMNNLYEWESRVFKQCGEQITQAYNKHTGTSSTPRNPKSHHLSCFNFEP